MYFAKQKRAKLDKCNICSQMAELSWDHIPPKFCNNDSAKEYMVALGVNDKLKNQSLFPLTTQNGVKYRSICKCCNNTLLGSDTDPAYKLLVDKIIAEIQSKLVLLEDFEIDAQVNRLARSVVGHMLASKNFYDDSCTVDKQLRQYFLDTSLYPPARMQLFCFLYPYETTMIARDICSLQSDQVDKRYAVPFGMISCMYSFPVAFLLTEECPDLPFENLFSLCSCDINAISSIKLSMKSLFFPGTATRRSPFWPCNISDTTEGPFGIIAGQAAKDIVMARNKHVINQRYSVNK